MSIKKKFEQIQSVEQYLESIIEDLQDCLGDISYLSTQIIGEIEVNKIESFKK